MHRLWQIARRGRLPSTADFAVLSVALYYDVGLIFELFWGQYNSSAYSFAPLLNRPESVQIMAFIILLVMPWMFLFGRWLTDRNGSPATLAPFSEILPRRRISFYVASLAVCAYIVALGASYLAAGSVLWETRVQAGEDFGPLIILLYLPLHVLAFFVRQKDSRTRWGWCFALVLTVSAIVSTVAIGQRTAVLLPVLMIGVFMVFRRLNVRTIAVQAGVLLLLAGLLLPLYKWQFSAGGVSQSNLYSQIVTSDLSRAPVLGEALENSVPFGTRVLPYSLAGYVYSTLFFVPRLIAPFKGLSTSTYFTAHAVGSDPASIRWGYGLGAAEELSLNGGILFVLPGLVFYGAVMGLLDRLSRRFASTSVPTRLFGLWICGYHLPALLMLFGAMVAACTILELVFATRQQLRSPERAARPGSVVRARGRLTVRSSN